MAIFQRLSSGPMAVNELASVLPVTRPAVSQHLKVLKAARLVTDHKEGTRRLYRLDPEGIERLRAHFDQMWTRALGSFQEAVEQPAEQGLEEKATEESTGGSHGRGNRARPESA